MRPLVGLWDYLGRAVRFPLDAQRFLIGTFLMGLGQGAIWVHMNLFYRALGLGEQQIGQILSFASLGTVLVALPAAQWVDRFPAQVIFSVGAAGFALLFAAQLVFPVWPMLLLASLVGSMLFTIHWVAAAPFFMRTTTGPDRIYLFGFAHAAETVSTIAAAAGVGALARALTQATGNERDGLRFALLAAAVLSLLAVAPFSAIRSSPPREGRRKLIEYLRPRDAGFLFRLTFPAALIGLGAGLVIPFLNLYFRDRFQQDAQQIGGAFAIGQALTVAGFLAGPALAQRFGSVRCIVGTELASIPFFLALAWATTLPVALIAFWMRGALMTMNQPISSHFTTEVVAPEQQAVANSLRTLAWNGAWMFSTLIGGWWIERSGFTPPMLTTIGCYLASAGIFWFWFRRYEVGGRAARSGDPVTPPADG